MVVVVVVVVVVVESAFGGFFRVCVCVCVCLDLTSTSDLNPTLSSSLFLKTRKNKAFTGFPSIAA